MVKIHNKDILFGITGKDNEWEKKLSDLNNLHVETAALFLERFGETQRKKIYLALLQSSLKNIPLCHIKNDMEVEELVFLEAKFKTEYFTVHESSFSFLPKWPGFEKKIFLEMDYNNSISKRVDVEKIGGFCIDLAHFKAAMTCFAKEFDYTYFRKEKNLFLCNHLNGYDEEKNKDIHEIKNLEEFDYLKTLPDFVFSKVIALEVENGITEQIEFKNYLVKTYK